MTKVEADREFIRDILPVVITRYGAGDVPARREAWNDWTDMLCKEGRITKRQYDTWVNSF